jgi:predicted dinucleotide-binding enzyme
VVAALIEEIGFAPVDAGSLADGVALEPGGAVFNVELDRTSAERLLAR